MKYWLAVFSTKGIFDRAESANLMSAGELALAGLMRGPFREVFAAEDC
jgi:hypothetical protein